MRFEKWHAVGNAYLLVEQPDAGPLTPERVRRLCDVDTGIGSDGVLEVTARDACRAVVRIWNPDGSTAELSGNGTRIVAAWLLREGGATAVDIETDVRVVHAVRGDVEGTVRQELGAVHVGEDEELDVAGERISIVPVDVGNPHAVVRREALSRDELLRLGPALETHPRFPGRTNVQLAVPRRNDVSVLVWERGAGETAASGSSAVAVAAAATARGWCAGPVRVTMPGGTLVVTIAEGRATLEGPAEEICAGTTEL